MYKIETYEEQSFTMYRLSNEEADSWITICPERGGIITGFGVDGEEQLYLNKETLYDRSKNIRGGIPILFPISGQLEQGKYEWEGKTYEMPNHGLARIHPWEVIHTDAQEDGASVTIRFASSIGTKESFPFDFEVLFTYKLTGNQLTIEQNYQNLSNEAMPIYSGFHPYFKSETKKVTLKTDATKYFDYNDDTVKEFTGSIDLEGLKESVVLLDAEERSMTFQSGSPTQIELEAGSEFAYTVLWTEQGKEFICIEPWMAKTDELNKKEELQLIPPQDTMQTFVSLRVVRD
ncbi:aldose epimerase [Sediminibacillus massiliensis]|uniref:aldose epimerase family protein n=1 Tax=Sediminibacillus massiliensis TaxID=1926277 RepID=UPI00098856C6|nr:aldose epimerase [Sediminibacillus massiliensis]